VGEVVGILRRNPWPFVAVIDRGGTSSRPLQPLLVPRRPVLPRLRPSRDDAPTLAADVLYALGVGAWPSNERFPEGVVRKAIGPVGEPAAESEAILIEHSVNTAPFSEEACASLPAAGWVPSADDLARRLDLREGVVGESICSVDPPGAVDIDDALHAVELSAAADGSRRYEVGVHIADVGHFIKAGQALSDEAAQRGTTFYLVDQRVNMVPSVLGENVSSLHERVDRLAFSILWQMDEHATVLSSRVEKTVIRSRAALSYATAQRLVDGEPCADDDGASRATLSRSLRTLSHLARRLRDGRTQAGALRLASPQVKFTIDDDGDSSSDGSGGGASGAAMPSEMSAHVSVEAHSMVEEFMLLANVTVARTILERFPRTALLRRHPMPEKEAFGFLHDALELHGFGLDLSTSRSLAQSLDGCVKPDEPFFNELTRYMAVRAMPPAQYVCVGDVEESGGSYYHFGLASPVYSHFTSPIRRYADQVVHRMLAVAIGWEAPSAELGDPRAMRELAESLNERHASAKEAQRASVGLYSLLFFRDRPVVEPAYALRLKPQGLSVLVPKYGIEGWISLMDGLPSGTPPFRYDKEGVLVAEGCTLRPMDKVLVRISVDRSGVHPRLHIELLGDDASETAPS
jgi:exosome complex exonuclease DIS3/RRP44